MPLNNWQTDELNRIEGLEIDPWNLLVYDCDKKCDQEKMNLAVNDVGKTG